MLKRLKRLLCRYLGHRWTGWYTIGVDSWLWNDAKWNAKRWPDRANDEFRECRRCHIKEVRRASARQEAHRA